MADQSPGLEGAVVGVGGGAGSPQDDVSDITGTGPNAAVVMVDEAPSAGPLVRIWDDDKITKTSSGWTCIYCNSSFKSANATKAASRSCCRSA